MARRAFLSFSPMDKFRQAPTSCQVCQVTKGERLSFRGVANNEREPRETDVLQRVQRGSTNAQQSFE